MLPLHTNRFIDHLKVFHKFEIGALDLDDQGKIGLQTSTVF